MNTLNTREIHQYNAIIYHVDVEDKIILVNDKWLIFAKQNDAGYLTFDYVRNKKIWDFITGIETKALYKMIFDNVRSKNQIISLPFRCDSPDMNRFMNLQIEQYGNDQIKITSHLVREEKRTFINLTQSETESPDWKLYMCSWCKKIKIKDDQWVEIEEGIKYYNLFESFTSPRITHGICDKCYEIAIQEINTH